MILKYIFIVFLYGFTLMIGVASAYGLIVCGSKLLRKWTVNRRIIRQAKAAGVWGDLEKIGGNALTIYARRHGVFRREGETDEHLRLRIYSKRKGQF